MVVSARTKARFKACLTIISQNCRGLKTEARLDEVICVLSSRDAFLACVQETWRPGQEEQCCGPLWLLGARVATGKTLRSLCVKQTVNRKEALGTHTTALGIREIG